MEKNSKETSIVIATGSFGGPATYSKLLSHKLPLLGYKVKVVSFGEVLKYPKIIRHFVYFFKVIFKSKGAEIIYTQDPVSTGLPALFVSKILGKRFFLKIVGDYAWEQGQQRYGVTDLLNEFVEKNNYSFPVRFFKWLQFFVAKRAEKIIVPSSYLKEIVGKWGVDQNKINVIYNAFNEPKALGSRNELQQKLEISFPTIVSVGRLVPWKGFTTLIEAISILKKDFPLIKMIIIDDGPDKALLERKVSELKLKDAVSFLGRMPQEKVYEYIKAADCFALLSSYEGFSHLLIETLAIETPIVTTPVGGNIEIIKDKENGLTVPFGDATRTAQAIKVILINKEETQAMVTKGKEDVKGFTEERMLQNLSKILR